MLGLRALSVGFNMRPFEFSGAKPSLGDLGLVGYEFNSAFNLHRWHARLTRLRSRSDGLLVSLQLPQQAFANVFHSASPTSSQKFLHKSQ